MKIKWILSMLSIFLLGRSYSSAGLLISEVLVDGTDEFIELYNDGPIFSGSLIFEGTKSSILSLNTITIASQSFYLLGDNGIMLDGISLQKSGLSLSLGDTNALNITIKDASGTILDTFSVDQSTVVNIDNTKTSFQKLLVSGNWIITGSLLSQNYYAVNGYTINPGKLSVYIPVPIPEVGNGTGNQTTSGDNNAPLNTGNLTTGDNSGNTGNQNIPGSGDINTGGNLGTTGDNQIGNIAIGNTGQSSNTGSLETTGSGIHEALPNSLVQIHEIHPGNDEFFKEYLELYFETAYSGSLRIVGAGHGMTEKTIVVSQGSKSRILLGGEDFGFGNYIVDGFSLTDGGENLVLIGQDGQVLDSVVYNGQVTKKSLYRGGVGEGAKILFDQIDIMTPGYSKEQVKHLLPSTSGYSLPCTIDFQNRTPWYAGTSMNISALWNKETISNNNIQFQCNRKVGTTVISNQCNPNYILLTGAVLDTLSLEVSYGGDICIQSVPLNIPERISGSSTSSSNNGGGNYYMEYQLWKDKFYDLLRTVRLLGFDLSTSKLLSIDERVLSASLALTEITNDFSGSLFLDAVLPNPKGKDSVESVRVLSQGTGIITGLYLECETQIIPLSSINLGDEIHTFSTGMKLPNDGSCVELKYGTKILDSLCYPKTKEGVWYTHSGVEGGEGVLLSGSKIEHFIIRQTTKEVCAYLDGKKILCEDLDRSQKDQKSLESSIKKLETKLKKREKEIVKLEKKIEKQDIKITKFTEKQQKLISSTKEIRQKYSERRKKKEATLVATRQRNSSLSELNRLHTSYIGFLEDMMYNERGSVSKEGFDNFSQTRVMHSLLEKSLKLGVKKEFVISPRIYGKSDMLLGLAHGKVNEELITEVYPGLYQELVESFQVIQENISKEEKNMEMVRLGKR